MKSFILAALYFLWMKTLKIRGDIPSEKAYVLGVWHQDLITALWYFRNTNMLIMLSQSKDANLFKPLLQRMTYQIIQGSSSRGFRNLRHLINEKYNSIPIGMALDGPKGPAKQVKAGTMWLSQKTKKQQIHLEVKYKSYWQLNTWDRMIIPRPFSTIEIKLNNLN